MNCLGNIIWLIVAGFWQALAWFFVGILWSITIVGIPIGRQCFKLARLSLCPFGKEVAHGPKDHVILNLLWLIFGGLELSLTFLVHGLVLCVSIIGIPFGLQCFKQASLALFPFGASVR